GLGIVVKDTSAKRIDARDNLQGGRQFGSGVRLPWSVLFVARQARFVLSMPVRDAQTAPHAYGQKDETLDFTRKRLSQTGRGRMRRQAVALWGKAPGMQS